MLDSNSMLIEVDSGFRGNERFELRSCLGEGPFGVVYSAYDRHRERAVALKVLRNLGPDSIFYFQQEFRALEGLEHPNLVRYRELFEDQGRWFLSMDLVEGVGLARHVREGDGVGPLNRAQLDRLRHALLGVAAALRALHAEGKVHGDVKSSNVRIDAAERVVLLDFGLLVEPSELMRGPLGIPDATARYLAPEQAKGEAPGPEADWYAVGVLMYECLVGRPPFSGEPEQVLRDKASMAQAPRPGEVAAPLPLELELLCHELLSPSPAARRGAIARFERVLAGRVASVPPQPLSLPSQSYFVGRDAELEQLLDVALDHATPRLRMALLYGESGLGKTALLEELRAHLGEQHPELRILTGRCFERETVPYNALDGVIHGLADLLSAMSTSLLATFMPSDPGALLRTFPPLARALSLDVPEPPSAPVPVASEQVRAFGQLRELLERIARDAPLVVVIDDVQWADADSLRSLEAIFAADRAPGCMLLCAGRTRPAGSDGVARVLRRIESAARKTRRVHLRPLDEAHCRTLCERILSGIDGADALTMEVVRECGGSPMFVEVLARHVRRHPPTGSASLTEALEAAHEALDVDARRLVDVLALSAAPLELTAAKRATRLSPASFRQAFANLSDLRWARTGKRGSELRLELTHQRIRAAALAKIEPLPQAELHWEIAHAMLSVGGDPEPIAVHFAEAGDAERATAHALHAAREAAAACAFSHAERLFLLALTHMPKDQPQRRREVSLELARVHRLSGRGREAGDLYAELSRGASGDEALDLRFRAAEAWLDSGYHEEGLPFIRALLSDLGASASAGGVRARLRWGTARLEALLRASAPAYRDAEGLDPKERWTTDAWFKLTCATLTADPLHSRVVQASHLAGALRTADPYRIARAYALEAWLHPHSSRTRGRFGLRGNLSQARRYARLSESPHAHALVQLSEGVLALSDDRYATASESFERASRVLRQQCPEARWERTYAAYYGSLCAWYEGRFEPVRDAVEVALHDAAAQGDALAEELWRSRLGHVPSMLADVPDAAASVLAEVSGPSRLLPHAPLHALLSRVEVELYRNDAWAFDLLDARWADLVRAGSLEVRSTRRRALWTRARAALCSARLNGRRRAALLQVALDEATRIRADDTCAAQARAQLIESAVHELRGERVEARNGYARAARLAEAAGCGALVATADGRRAALLDSEEGQALADRAHAYLRRAGATDPARLAAVLNGF